MNNNTFIQFLATKLNTKEIDSLPRPKEMFCFYEIYCPDILNKGYFDFKQKFEEFFDDIDNFPFPNINTQKILIINYLIRDIEKTNQCIEIYRSTKDKLKAKHINLIHYGIKNVKEMKPNDIDRFRNNLEEIKKHLIIELNFLKTNHEYTVVSTSQELLKIKPNKIIWIKDKNSLITLFLEMERLGFIHIPKDINHIYAEHFAVLSEDSKNIEELEPNRIKDYKAKIINEYFPAEPNNIIKTITNKINKNTTDDKTNEN